MKSVKRYFTLLETLIATALTVLVLSTLTYFYQQIDFLNNKSEAIQKENFKLLNMDNRLSNVLPMTIKEDHKDFYFFTVNDPTGLFKQGSPKSLVFTYDNRIDINKSFALHALGQLFLDPQGRLTLATWPASSRWPDSGLPSMKREILLDGVESLNFSFFIPPDRPWNLNDDTNKSKKNTTAVKTIVKPTPEGGWVDEWSYDYRILPGLVRLEIKRNGVTENYVFPLPNASRQIVYTQ